MRGILKYKSSRKFHFLSYSILIEAEKSRLFKNNQVIFLNFCEEISFVVKFARNHHLQSKFAQCQRLKFRFNLTRSVFLFLFFHKTQTPMGTGPPLLFLAFSRQDSPPFIRQPPESEEASARRRNKFRANFRSTAPTMKRKTTDRHYFTPG